MGFAGRLLVFVVLACMSYVSLAEASSSGDSASSSSAISIAEKEVSTDESTQSGSIKKTSSPRELGTTTSWPVVILTLLGIIGFIFLLAWGTKRFGGLSAMGIRDMKVVAAMPVGTRERVAVIDVKGQQFLIGITAQNINHLHSFEEPVITADDKRPGEFAEKLAKIMSAKNNEA